MAELFSGEALSVPALAADLADSSSPFIEGPAFTLQQQEASADFVGFLQFPTEAATLAELLPSDNATPSRSSFDDTIKRFDSVLQDGKTPADYRFTDIASDVTTARFDAFWNGGEIESSLQAPGKDASASGEASRFSDLVREHVEEIPNSSGERLDVMPERPNKVDPELLKKLAPLLNSTPPAGDQLPPSQPVSEALLKQVVEIFEDAQNSASQASDLSPENLYNVVKQMLRR